MITRRITGEAFTRDYLKAINATPDQIPGLNENLRRPLMNIDTIVDMYNDLAQEMEEAKELVYKLTMERVLG